MKLSQLCDNKLSFKHYNDRYVDVKVVSASWKKTKKENPYLSIELELCSEGEVFDKPVGLFLKKDLRDIVSKIGSEKYPEQVDPDVSESDIVGLVFNAKVSVNENGFASLKDINLDDSNKASAKTTKVIDDVMDQFTQQISGKPSKPIVDTLEQDSHQNQMQTTSMDEDHVKEQLVDNTSSSLQQDPIVQLLEDDVENKLESSTTPVPEKKSVGVESNISSNPFSNVPKTQSNPFEEDVKSDEGNENNDEI